jgi:hypothetical protein
LKRKLAYDLARLKQRFAHEALSILDKENGILVSYSLAGNMHYTGERRFAIMENDALIAKEGNTKFTSRC